MSCVRRLLDEIELAAEVYLELLAERSQLQQPRSLGALFQEADRRGDHVQVEVDLLDDPRSAHLDDDVAPVGQERTMDLGDRGRRERFRIEPRERVGAEVVPDDPLDLRKRKRRHLVHEPAELLDVDVGKQVRPRREQLAELQVRRPELLQREPELDRAFARRGPHADDAELAEHAQQAPAARHARDLESAARALDPSAHAGFFP